jgi:hypothetical protein
MGRSAHLDVAAIQIMAFHHRGAGAHLGPPAVVSAPPAPRACAAPHLPGQRQQRHPSTAITIHETTCEMMSESSIPYLRTGNSVAASGLADSAARVLKR